MHIKGYKNVTSGDAQALRLAIAQQGPISVAIDASHLSFVFYSNGVYYEPACGNCCCRNVVACVCDMSMALHENI